MEECWENWLSELESDDCGFYEQCDMTRMDSEWLQSQDQDELKQRESNSSNSGTMCRHSGNITSSLSIDEFSGLEPPKVHITSSNPDSNDNVFGTSSKPTASSPSSYILCFDNCESPPTVPLKTASTLPANLSSSNLCPKSPNFEPRSRQYTKRPHSPVKRSSRRSADHIMTERLRRERITCKFIELSALIPGLKKTDKSSVLSDAIKYLKQLKERIQILEEQNKKRTVDTVVVMTAKSQQSAEEVSDTFSNSGDEISDSSDHDTSNDTSLEVEARVSGRDVLIRVRCRRERGMLNHIFTETEKLPLSVVNSSAFPFGSSSLEVCIIAQVDSEMSMKAKDLAKNIRQALLLFV